ncbi:MAG: SipW-dependent-type signal peptide-containing protein [Acutalibacteraceae bacterium]|nr:SipW-dependent-type signal peptide-containing protein [Acutalibacteraceae bacterium]
MKKRNLLSVISLGLVASVAIAGTAAYLTSTDEDTNTMVLGKVKIDQREHQRVQNADGTYATGTVDARESYLLEEFVQDKLLLPIVGDPNKGEAGWDTIPVRMSQVGSAGGMDVFDSKNAQDKFVTVKNTGNNDAYVRTIVAIEHGDASADLVRTSYHNTWKSNALGDITISGDVYSLYEYVYLGGKTSTGWRHENGVLPKDEVTYPNLSQVYLGSEATNEDVEKLDANGNGKLDILVFSQAVQADGFADAKTALDKAFGETKADNPVILEQLEKMYAENV